ncbi:MAG: endonuclease/exonuclease/phosphatase family protein [Pirellulaceae bacterium]
MKKNTSFGLRAAIAVVALQQVICPDWCVAQDTSAQLPDDVFFYLPFEGSANENNHTVAGSETPQFVPGLDGKAIRVQPVNPATSRPVLSLPIQSMKLNQESDFSLQFWVRTTIGSEQRAVLMSTKDFPDNGLNSQKSQGWVFGVFNGTWAWNMGSGKRRISYDRTNGEYLPINDGRWHQLAMTHSAEEGLIRLYFDGKNMVTYNVRDSAGFKFGNDNPLSIGWDGEEETRQPVERPVFVEGARDLQQLVDEFDRLGLPAVTPDEFESLVSQPKRLFETKIAELRQQNDDGNTDRLKQLESVDLQPIEAISQRLMGGLYTVHQSRYYNEIALLFRLYRFENGNVVIHEPTARRLARREVLTAPAFDLDELRIWKRALSADEVMTAYTRYFQHTLPAQPEQLTELTAGCWNIWHGGIHHSLEIDGWDSRQSIIDLLKREQVDVIMMQETYSNGDHIAAELGFYYATTIDWDNLHQGPNISVLSRYPIKKIVVPPNSTFMNVAALVELGESQDIYVMSNWYGMRNFEDVYSFHESRFNETDSVPILFGGDFNAIPDVDGGNSLAYRMLTEAEFVDAYRQLYPDVEQLPGHTHRSDRRIDQLYYKGAGLENRKTEVFSTWPSRFPSDHYLIKSVFDLNYKTRDKE